MLDQALITGELILGNANILYLTSKCNFNCEYCYEHNGNSHASKLFSITEEQACKNIQNIILSERIDEQTIIVLFGGEPTLNWEVLKKAVRYGYSLKKNIMFDLSTNGWKFRSDKFCEDFLQLARDIDYRIGLDLSFDGVGNYRRKLLSGADTTDGMYEVLKNISKYRIPYNLRYTIHEANVDLAVKDLTNFDKFFNPDKYVISFDSNNLTLDQVNTVKAGLRQAWIDGDITKPICDEVCDLCCKCDKSGGITYWASHGNIRNLSNGENAKSFDDF